MRRPSLIRVARSLLWLGAVAGCLWIVRSLLEGARPPPPVPPHYHWLKVAESGITTGFTGPVVKIVHQSWIDRNLPPQFARWSRTFPRCFPDFQYRLWTDDENRRLIASHYPWFLPRYDSYKSGVQKADVARLFYMHQFGGVYCDMDCECLRNFQHLLANTSLALGAMNGTLVANSHPAFVPEGQIENSFMYSRPGHPFFWDLILRLNATTEEMAIMSTGTYLIMSGIHAARNLSLDRRIRIDDRPFLTIYPPQHFNPFSWIAFKSQQCKLFGMFTQAQLKNCRESFPHSYIIQYHTQVWGRGRKRIFEIQVPSETERRPEAPKH